MFERIKRYIRQKNTINELNRLTDIELNDIGISRSEIKNVVKNMKF